MLPNIAEAFRIYAHKTPKLSVGRIVEQAFIEFMQSHPLEDVLIMVQQKFVDDIDSVQSRLEQKILCKEMDFCLVTLDRIEEKGIGDKDTFQERLIVAVKQAIKIKNPNDTLIALMEKIDDDGYIR